MPNGTPTSPPPQLPGWLGPIITLTTQVGVPTVIAGILLWFVLSRVDGVMRVIQEEEETRTKTVAAMQDATIAALDKLGQRFEQAINANIQANRDLADRHARPPDR